MKFNKAYKTGLKYRYGKGVAQDPSEAIKRYRKSADQGHAGSQYVIGGMYDKGEGITQDYAEPLMWWRKAADKATKQRRNSFRNSNTDRLAVRIRSQQDL